MKFLLILLAVIWPFSTGKPVKEAIVIIEKVRGKIPVAWQQTGESGKVSVAHLDAGSYHLVVEFPYLDGKWTKTKRRHRVMTKASYNQKNKTYYYQGEEGYFSIKFSKTRRIENEKFNPVFREIRTENGFQYVIANFQTIKDATQISFKIKKLTAVQFKRKVEKIDHDISMFSIPVTN